MERDKFVAKPRHCISYLVFIDLAIISRACSLSCNPKSIHDLRRNFRKVEP